jgi:hypothetical protein
MPENAGVVFSKPVTSANLIFQAVRNFSWITESKKGFEGRNCLLFGQVPSKTLSYAGIRFVPFSFAP